MKSAEHVACFSDIVRVTLGHIRPLAAVLEWIPFSAARGITNRIARDHSTAVPTS
jgi:hypothetical protein